jgi:hypothetical protein
MVGLFSREGASKFAKDVADHLEVIGNVKALQQGQRELADALVKLGDRIRAVEMEMQVLKAETRLEALKESQLVINSVQGALNQRMQDLAVKVELHDVLLRSHAIGQDSKLSISHRSTDQTDL